MLYSIIDIGSNTVKSAVYTVDGNNIKNVGFFTKQLGLIARIKDGILLPDAIKELCGTINEYKSKVDSTVYCFATESLRRIDNLEEVMYKIKIECETETELISSKDEAILSFNGFLATSPDAESGIMVDMGGGSTEILKFNKRTPLELNSFRFGCLSLRRDYVKGRFPTKVEQQDIRTEVDCELRSFPWIKDSETLCLVGGTGSSIGKLAIELGYTTLPEFSSDTFMELFDYLWDIDDHKIALLEKYIPARVETILPGMCAYRRIIETVNAKKVYISKGGIRDGFLYSKLRGCK